MLGLSEPPFATDSFRFRWFIQTSALAIALFSVRKANVFPRTSDSKLIEFVLNERLILFREFFQLASDIIGGLVAL